eukprot:SAG31_NODE_3542_length_4143_cov_2.092977_6_plen_83_part_00
MRLPDLRAVKSTALFVTILLHVLMNVRAMTVRFSASRHGLDPLEMGRVLPCGTTATTAVPSHINLLIQGHTAMDRLVSDRLL